MNARVVVAQAGPGSANGTPPVQTITIVKPAAGQSQTYHPSADGTVKIDFTAIANEKITLYHDNADQSLHIIFADGSQAIILPFFDASGVLGNLLIEVGNDLDLNGTQFASQFPISTDQSVLPAAGNSGNPASGADFHDTSVEPLSGFNGLSLLGPDNVSHGHFNNIVPNFVETIAQLHQLSGSVGGIVEEEQLGNGSSESSGDGPSFTFGNEDPNDSTAPPGGNVSDGLDQDTYSNPNITTDVFHGTGVNSLSHLVSGGSGTLTFFINSAVAGATVLDRDGHPVTSGGSAVHYSQVFSFGSGDSFVIAGTGSGTNFQPVFDLTIHSNGDYDFVLLHQIDHPNHTVDVGGSTSNGSLEEALYLDLTSLVSAHDQGSQTLTLTGHGSFTIGVLDDTPVAHDVTGTSDENQDKCITLYAGVDYNFGADGAGVGGGVSFGTPTVDGAPSGVTLGLPTIIVHHDGHSISIDPGTAFDALAQGETALLHIPYTVTDGDGDSVVREITLTITGENDAPVIGAASVTTDSVTEAGDLLHINEAGLGEKLAPSATLNAQIAGNSTVTNALSDLLTNPADVHATLGVVESQLHVDVATAIAVVWQYLDSAYAAGPSQTNVNEAFTYLGIEYASYVKTGGVPLVDVTAKYTADGPDAGTLPDRLQSLHDNLLGNLTLAALQQRYGGNPSLLTTLESLINGVDPNLLNRPYYDGGESHGAAAVAAHTWDVNNGYVSTATGTLIATDVDHNAVLTWSANTTVGTYGTFAIDPTSGQWTYKLDNSLPTTEALAAGQTATETFTATVTDEHGATDTVNVTITVHGANDAPIANPDTGSVTEAGLHPGNHFDPGSWLTGGNVLSNDTDVDTGDTKTVVGLAAGTPAGDVSGHVGLFHGVTGTYGSLVIGANGTWGYVLNNFDPDTQALAQGETVADVFTYTMRDASGSLSTSTITITVTGTNDRPTASWQFGIVDEGISTTDVSTTSGNLLSGASDPDHGAVLSIAKVEGQADGTTGVVGSHGTLTWDAASGHYVYTLDNTDPSVQALAEGEHATDAFAFTVTDEFGGTSASVLTVTIEGTNDAPVIGNTSVTTGSVTEAGDLPQIDEAGLHGALEPTAALNAQIAGNSTVTNTLTDLLTNPGDVHAALTTVETQLGVNAATAIAVVWDYLDDIYVSAGPNQGNVNQAFTYLGVEYAEYLKAGGSPLVDVTAKYTADGPDAGTLPDRLQSLHDNLLGNLTLAALQQRYGSNPALLQQMINLVSGADANFLTRPYYDGGETHGAAGAAAHQWDTDHGYVSMATGTLVATDVDHNAHLTWSANTTVGSYGTFALDASTGVWTYSLDNSLATTQALAQGETGTETFTATVTDEHGATDTVNVTITVTGTNDAPVIDASSDVTGSVKESGDLPRIEEAGIDGPLQPTPALIDQIVHDSTAFGALFDVLFHPAHVSAALSTLHVELGLTKATSIAVLWSFLDGAYVAGGPNQTDINKAFTRLGVQYAEYLQAGGSPLVDVTAKYTADGPDAGTTPDRLQSLHDNLLGNLTLAALQQRYGSDPALLQHMTDLVSNVDPNLLTRPYYDGGETHGAAGAAAHQWDIDHGYVPTATGTLLASDIDHNAVLHWSANTSAGTYGTFAIDPTSGQWVYKLDNALPATEALAKGETATETFAVTVTDEHGATDTINVTVTVTGANDAPVITAAQATGALTEDVHVNAHGNLHATGTIDFTDVDLSDTHTVSVQFCGCNAELGTLHAHLVSDTTGGTGGEVNWNYVVDDAAVQYLAAGETVDQHYFVTVNDGHGGRATEEVDLTVTGRNDAPVITDAQTTGAVTEDVNVNGQGKLHDSGTINFSDVDLSDTHYATVAFVGTDNPGGAQLGTMGRQVTVDTTGFGTGGEVTWNYRVDDSAVQQLNVGQTITETYAVTVHDHNGGTATQDVSVTIHGADDAPTDIMLDSTTIPAGNNAGDVVAHVSVTDVDDTAFTFAITNPDHSANTDFSITGGPGNYQLVANNGMGALPPYITITATDSGGLSYSENFAITLPVQLFAPDHTTLLGSFATIQQAVDAAGVDGHVGDFIQVGAGTYHEQVVVDPSHGHGVDGLVIHGLAGATVEAPDTLVSTGNMLTGSMRSVDGIITVSGATDAHIDGLTVDGLDKGGNVVGPNNPTLVGIAYLNASGAVDGVDVTGVREGDAQFGDQRGLAIVVSNDLAHAGNAFALTNSTIEDFQKGAVVVFNADVDIANNTITGYGATNATAQNGIELVGVTGTVDNNTIAGIGYIPQTWTASGILFWDSNNLSITNNHITGPVDGGGNPVSFTAVYGLNSSDIAITGNNIANVLYGIVGYEDGTFSTGAFAPTWTVGDTNVLTNVSLVALDFEVAATNVQGFDVAGTGGNDYFSGGAGNDTFHGNAGDDTFVYNIGGGQDTIDGGIGTDTLNVYGTSSAETFNINPTDAAHLGINIESGASTVVGATGANAEVITSSVEDIVIHAGNAGDTVVISGDLSGTGVALHTITVEGGAGNDTVDASGIAPSYPVDVVFNGWGGDDTFVAGPGNNTFDGGSGNDTVVFGSAFDASQLGLSGNALTYAGTTILGVEQIQFSDTRVLIVEPQGGANSYSSAYTTIQSAINAAHDGDTIYVADGTYNENLSIHGKHITLVGQSENGVTLNGQIVADGTLDGQLAVKNMVIDAAGHQYGVYVTSNTTDPAHSAVLLDHVVIKDAGLNGFAYIEQGNGSTPTHTDTIGSIAITNSDFSNNATQTTGANGRGDILLFGYNGNFTVDNVTIHDPGAGAQKAIQMRGVQDGGDVAGVGPYDPAGSVQLFGLNVTGSYQQDLLAFYNIASFASFATSGGHLDASAPWGLFNFDGVGGAVDLSGSNILNNQSPGAPIAVEQGLASSEFIIGTSGDDIFDGRGGNDTLAGGGGNDLYFAHNGDTIVEQANGGTDEVRTADSFVLPANVENLTLLDGPSNTQTFDHMALGPITNGENGWLVNGTGADQEVVDLGNGDHAFRMSSDPSLAWFAGPYSPALPAAAGEPDTGAPFNSQLISFTFEAVNAIPDGSRLEIDFGNAAGTDRNNFLVLESFGSGVRIAVSEPDLSGNWSGDNSSPAPNDWRQLVNNVDPTVAHTLELRLTYVDGPNNDVIKVYLDGQYIGQTTTFENYHDSLNGLANHIANAIANETDRVFFRPSGNGSPQDGAGGQNQGFYIDNLTTAVYNNSNATGNSLDNVITGNSGDNIIAGLGGDDTINAGAGNDTILYTIGDGRDVVDGGSGVDTLDVTGSAANENFVVWTKAAYNADPAHAGSQYTGPAEILVTVNDVIVTEAKNIEEIVVHGDGGTDSLSVNGDFSGTSLLTSTITYQGDAGDDTIDVSKRLSNHRVVVDGQGGVDIAILGFASTDAGISYAAIVDGSSNVIGVKITHLVNGVSVTDEFTNVEAMQFTDGKVLQLIGGVLSLTDIVPVVLTVGDTETGAPVPGQPAGPAGAAGTSLSAAGTAGLAYSGTAAALVAAGYTGSVLGGLTGDQIAIIVQAIAADGGNAGTVGMVGDTYTQITDIGPGSNPDTFYDRWGPTANGGDGGDGGRGGDAMATISNSQVQSLLGHDAMALHATSIGGNGGAATAGGDGGYGGKSGSENSSASVSTIFYGTAGGDGGHGGQGGDGGNAVSTITGNTIAQAESGTIDLIALATGGDGSDGAAGGDGGMGSNGGNAGNGGDGGDGGNATATIDHNQIAAGAEGTAITITVTALGGDGGAGGAGGHGGLGKTDYWNDWGINQPTWTHNDGSDGVGGNGGTGGSAIVNLTFNTIGGGDGNDTVTISLEAHNGLGGLGGSGASNGSDGGAVIDITGNTIHTGLGNDTISVAAQFDRAASLLLFGNNVFDGGGGDDILKLSVAGTSPATLASAANHFDGGSGFDTLDLSGWDRAVEINAAAGTIRLDAAGGDSGTITGFEHIVGTAYGDVFDNLSGNVNLTGGAGDDTFGFTNPFANGPVEITDFNNTTEHDSIAVSASGFGGGLIAGMDVTSVFSATADSTFGSTSERFHYDTSTDTLYYGAGGSAGPAIALAHLEAGVMLDPHQNIHVMA